MPVNTQHADYKRMADKWKRCRDVSNGQDAVHEAGKAYLPELKDQPPDEYSAYVKRTPFYNATWRTVVGLKGMVFRQPPKLEAPESLLEMLEDVTTSGVPLQLFAQEVVEEALKLGRLGVLVDYPTADTSTMTLADTKEQNLRPTMQLYLAESIINWQTGRVNNATVLTMVVLEEEEEIKVDEWTTKCEKRYRVLDLVPAAGGAQYRVRLYRMEGDKEVQIGTDLIPQMGSKPLDYIPFTFISTDDTTPAVDEPPLIDLVDMNLSHYRTSADLEHGAHFTGLPTAVITGYKPENPADKLYIGSSAAWVLPNADADAKFLEFTGQGLGALERLKEAKETQMAVLGARMLEQQKKAVETAETTSIHRKGEESTLSMAAQTVSRGLQLALQWFATWAGADKDAVEFELNRDFYPQPMTPQQLTALVTSWQAGAFSNEVLFENLKQGEIIGEGTDFEEEQRRLEQQAPTLTGQGIDPKTGLPTEAPPALPGKKPAGKPPVKPPAKPGKPAAKPPTKGKA